MIYLLTHTDEGGGDQVEVALVGPPDFDIEPIRIQFEKAVDLYYECFDFNQSWNQEKFDQWRESYHAFRVQNAERFAHYNELLADYLCANYGFQNPGHVFL